MVDKIDPPHIPDGYGLSFAVLCMLDVVKCVQILIEGSIQMDCSTEQNVQNQKQSTKQITDTGLLLCLRQGNSPTSCINITPKI